MIEDRSDGILAVAIVFTALTCITVPLRIYTRQCLIKSFGADDWAIVFAQLLFTIYLVWQFVGYFSGTGRHISDLTTKNAIRAYQAWFYCELFYVQSTCWAKIAIGLMLLRLATRRVHRWILYLLMSGALIFCQIFFIIVLLQCRPISSFWTRADITSVETGSCWGADTVANVTYAASALNSIADWTFAILPIWFVFRIQMKKSSKFLVAGVLSLGTLASIATVIRIPYIYTMKEMGDFLYATTEVAIWSTVEVGLGITAASMSTLRPLIRHISKLINNTPGRSSAGDTGRKDVTEGHVRGSAQERSWFEDLDDDGLLDGNECSIAFSEIVRCPANQKLEDIWVAKDIGIKSTSGTSREIMDIGDIASAVKISSGPPEP